MTLSVHSLRVSSVHGTCVASNELIAYQLVCLSVAVPWLAHAFEKEINSTIVNFRLVIAIPGLNEKFVIQGFRDLVSGLALQISCYLGILS